ncbi:MAG TPA: prepilin peptidase [Bryobacteraceae bacterium]|nr:prepilin peptidase [Bryobacteraceae bacterium]
MPELLAGLFGLLIGSFLNVCIHRWPRDLSVVQPRSACPECHAQIAAYDNIPVLSYLLLRGRCRKCGAKISWRYPLVEIATGLAFAFFVFSYGLNIATAKYCVLASLLIGLAFSDLETRILPDELTVGGALAGLVFAWFVPVPDPLFQFAMSPRWASFIEALIGAFACSGLLWLVGWLFEKLRHKEGLGFGDVKMLAMIGAFLGLQGAILTIVIGSMLGAISGLLYIRITGKDASNYQLPFGTFLAASAFVIAAEGPLLIGWYGDLIR